MPRCSTFTVVKSERCSSFASCKLIWALEEVILTLGCQSEFKEIVDVNRADRWQVYHRLQELDIPCSCVTEQPLMVQIADVVSAVQLWSVSRQFTESRQDLVWWLKRCWQYNQQR